ncbi:hypothetical protein [Kiloniella sp.]|uniref:hypothetical protein n=1 Tax=Kiloniella sp. TaxID=1938587 RepID=UPI003B014E38
MHPFSYENPRPLDKGMGVAVARRTVFRPEDDESMGKVGHRVAVGNTGLVDPKFLFEGEFEKLRDALSRGAFPSSGRHLQHGDENQPERNMEVFTNCSSAPAAFSNKYLALNGSGVGGCYDSHVRIVNWLKRPKIKLVLSDKHPDYPTTDEQWIKFTSGLHDQGLSIDQLKSLFKAYVIKKNPRKRTFDHLYRLEDSREGMAKSLEIYEAMAYEERSKDTLILNFDDIRCEGSPIAGMQDRPAAGPVPLIRAFINTEQFFSHPAPKLPHLSDEPWYQVIVENSQSDLRDEPWFQGLVVDHFFSKEVVVGGARRTARIAVKHWKEEGIFNFIWLKVQFPDFWTSNNSVVVDAEFWTRVRKMQEHVAEFGEPEWQLGDLNHWAYLVFQQATTCSWQTGDPGWVNVDNFESERTGRAKERVLDEDQEFGSFKYQADIGVKLLEDIAKRCMTAIYLMIPNPCGEVELHMLGAYCVVAGMMPLNNCPFNYVVTNGGTRKEPTLEECKQWDMMDEETVRLQTRFLMRVNQMDSLYGKEVRRTQRIGVSLTGVHEYAWVRHGLTFHDLLDENRSASFWAHIERLSNAAKDESVRYAEELGIEPPHTVVTFKPEGTTSKLYGCTEGAHLPPHRQYLRWVQYVNGDKLIKRYAELGYPYKELVTYNNQTIVGFPTMPLITRIGMSEDQIVTAQEATPEMHYKWVRLLEKYWLGKEKGNQISYTIQVYTDQHSLEEYRRIVLENQPTLRCCTIMPTMPAEEMGQEYLPEETVSMDQFINTVANINDPEGVGDIDLAHLQCASGACPI